MQKLIFFVKAPETGCVKSRLARVFGDEFALGLYRNIGFRSFHALRRGPYEMEVAFFPATGRQTVREWLGPDAHYFPQKGDDLGARMENAFREAFSQGAGKVVLIGSDIPEITGGLAEKAFALLTEHDAVINPTFDGGYCMIGFTRAGFEASVFSGIRWGTETVFAETMSAFRQKGASVCTLPPLRDIDRAEDLKFFPALLPGKKISVIVPVLGEEKNINPLIAHLRALEGAAQTEIIVVDGSPSGETLAVIADRGVTKISAAKGRAAQMNAGAAAADGEILVFLHADSRLPDNAFFRIRQTIDRGDCVGGAFDLHLDSRRPFIRFISWSAGLRSRLTRIPYGDQTIFLRRDYFEEIGRYSEIALMEDVELMSRVRKLGGKIRILAEPSITSARKYLQDGPVYSALRNHALRILYSLGVSPERLAKIYYRR